MIKKRRTPNMDVLMLNTWSDGESTCLCLSAEVRRW